MLNVGVVGCGHLGKIHIQLIVKSSQFNLSGIYDSNIEISKSLANEFSCKYYENIDKLFSEIDALIVVTPTPYHYKYAKKAIDLGIHTFIEKPVCSNLEDSTELLKISKSKNIKIQVGHVERFNSAYRAVKDEINNPMFIESHRLAKFNPRGTDVSVVLDLMIHDIDIILSCVNSKIKYISSSGVSIISKSPDIANARIEFENGCVANLTASRVSLKNMRKTRIFQKGKYISIDFLKKESEVVEVENGTDKIPISTLKLNDGQKKDIYYSKPIVKENNAILDELESFANSINKNTKPEVDIVDGHNALKIALKIINEFK